MKTEEYFNQWSKDYSRSYGRKEWPLFLRWIFDNILENLPKKRRAKIIDLGTGNGRLISILSAKFEDACFIGVDISEEMLKEAKKSLRNVKDLKLIKNKMHKFAVPDESIDYVVSNFALHHCRNKLHLFERVFKSLKKGGIMIFGDIFEKFDNTHIRKVNSIRNRNANKKFQFDKSITDTWNSLTAEQKRNHPIEFHIEPENYEKLLKSTGFKKIKIIRSLNEQIVVIKAHKPL